MSDEIIEMFWGCTVCSARSRGRFKNCEQCGAPRTDASPEYLPDDVQAAPAVTDPELLRKANAGADWRCRYCGSSAFRADGSCAQCGSPQADSTALEAIAEVPEPSDVAVLQPDRRRLVAGLALGAVVLAGILWALFRERVYDVIVAQVSWRSTVHIERYAVHGHESFTEGIVTGAFAQTSLGSRHHHDERILDHYVPVPYTVQEFAGYRSESYSAREACGESCYSTPRVCTSSKNGFARCTGGGEHCSTKYCSVTRTRQVPKVEYDTQHGYAILPQADPNGLFAPSSAEGTWVMCKDPGGSDVRPVYIEPRIVVSPFKLDHMLGAPAPAPEKAPHP
jgi:hypothetical protein